MCALRWICDKILSLPRLPTGPYQPDGLPNGANNAPMQHRPVGLVNNGNTCYFNALMQCIYQTHLMKWALEQHHPALKRQQKETDTPELAIVVDGQQEEAERKELDGAAECLMAFYKQVHQQSEYNADEHCDKKINPSESFHALCRRSSRFVGGRQQDSYEALRHFMDAVKQQEKNIVMAGVQSIDRNQPYRALTVVDRVFGGHYLTVYHCHECGTPYHLLEPFLDVSLPIAFDEVDRQEKADPCTSATSTSENISADLKHYIDAISELTKRLGDGQTIHHHSVSDSLRFHTRKEELDEYLCRICNKVTKGTKQMIIFNLPAILTLHLKRFEQGEDGRYIKVPDLVKFEHDLDLAPYCSRFSWRRQALPKVRYSLYGVVSHSGSLQGGHYTACVRMHSSNVEQTKGFLQQTFLNRDELMSKESLVELLKKIDRGEQKDQLISVSMAESDPRSTDWYDISDTSVTTIQYDDVKKKEAYLLFYERVY